VVTPSETAGPFPSIALPVRSDVREDRQGLPLALAITVVNAAAGCAPVTNASVEIWHSTPTRQTRALGARAATPPATTRNTATSPRQPGCAASSR
jgi:hypothetical protein